MYHGDMDPREGSPDVPAQMSDRERLLWRIWLGLVALLVVGSLLLTGLLIFVWQPSVARRGSPASPSSASSDAPAPPPAGVASFDANPQPAPAAGLGIVWVNTRSHIYHFPGYRWYGTTIQGKYTSERDALAEGDRAALNERRPANFGVRELQ